jgi:hypothetical protein
MYRGDPQFLQKTCDVCENCFLAYAKLTSSSFLMVLPVDPFGSDGELHYEIPIEKAKARPHNVMKSKTDQSVNKNTADATNPVERFDFGKAPVIPPAIIEPPKASVLHFFVEMFRLSMSASTLTPVHTQSASTNKTDSQTNDRAEPVVCFPDSEYSSKSLQHMIDTHKLLTPKPKSKMAGNPYEEDLVQNLRR